MREEIYYTVINKKNGARLVIGKQKYDREADEWEIIATQDIRTEREPLFNREQEKTPQEIIEETDLDLSAPSEGELDYHALKDILKAKGFEIKGNPKKEVLLDMYKEAI